MLRALSVNTFVSQEYHKEIRVQLVNYIELKEKNLTTLLLKILILIQIRQEIVIIGRKSRTCCIFFIMWSKYKSKK